MSMSQVSAGGRRTQALAALTRLAPLRPPAINLDLNDFKTSLRKGVEQMSTAKKTLYAAIGAGTTALSKARELPQKVVTLPSALSERVSTIRVDVRELPKTVQTQITSVPARATELADQARKLADQATTRFTKAYTDLSKRGETIAKKVRTSAPTKRAVSQTKSAKSKVKAAATSVAKATEADVEAVKAAVAKTADLG